MNEKIVNELNALENTINMLKNNANRAPETYNRIIMQYDMNSPSGVLGDNYLKAAGIVTFATTKVVYSTAIAGAGSAATAGSTALATTGSTALATTGSTALATTVGGGAAVGGTTAGGAVAAGAAVATPLLAVASAAISGFLVGGWIGEKIVNKWKIEDGKKALEDLKIGISSDKKLCESLSPKINSAKEAVTLALEKVQDASKKLSKQEYPKKKANMKRITKRYNELVAIKNTMSNLDAALSIIYTNLCKLY